MATAIRSRKLCLW